MNNAQMQYEVGKGGDTVFAWRMNDILYENGEYNVRAERFGKSKSIGFAVYQVVNTHSVRVARIGFTGYEGFQRAKKECDRRAVK